MGLQTLRLAEIVAVHAPAKLVGGLGAIVGGRALDQHAQVVAGQSALNRRPSLG